MVVPGVVTDQASGRRASRVQVYGVDDRFWRFHARHGAAQGPDARGAFISRALAADIGAPADSTVLVRVERPSAIPIESLHGRKDDCGRTLRLTVRAVLGAPELGDFSLRPQQGDVRAVFVPLKRAPAPDRAAGARQRAARVASSGRRGSSARRRAATSKRS